MYKTIIESPVKFKLYVKQNITTIIQNGSGFKDSKLLAE